MIEKGNAKMKRMVHAGKWMLAVVLSIGLLGIVNPTAASAAPQSDNAIQDYWPYSLAKKDGTYWVWGKFRAVPTQLHGIGRVERVFNSYVVTDDKKVWYLEESKITPEINIRPVTGISDPVYLYGELALDAKGSVYVGAHETEYQYYYNHHTTYYDQFKPLTGIDNVEKLTSYIYEYKNELQTRWLFLKKDGSLWEADGKQKSIKKVGSFPEVKSLNNELVLKKDGTVWTWLCKTSESNPVLKQVEGLSEIQALYGNLAIDRASRLWFWGTTYTGMSDGLKAHEHQKPILFKNISDVKEAYIVDRTIVALTNSGKVYRTSIDTESVSSDAKFELIASDISSFKANWEHIIMQKADGSLWGWGGNRDANLGYGDYEIMHEQAVPVQRAVALALNGEAVKLNNGVVIRKGQSFVPIRSIFEKLGAAIKYDEESKVVTISRSNAGTDSAELTIVVNYKTGATTLNGKEVQLENKPFAIKGTSYLPLRFISEKLGAKVDWSQKEDKILITMK